MLGLTARPSERLVCDICTATKATRLPFPVSSSMAEHPFDLVHTDLSGIIRVGNVENVNYFLLFVDDRSRFISVFLVGRKYQVARCYEEYSNWVRVQFGKTIKCLRSDNGTEFKNAKMQDLTKLLGTEREFTAHGNPQQNSRAERPMRSIDAIARALMKQAKLSIRFWPYAIMYAVWLKNRFPHAALGDDSPFFALFGKQPDLQNAKTFGSIWFVRDLQPDGKFADQAKPAIFLGCPHGTKGSYVYLIDERKVDISAHLWPSERVSGALVQTESTYRLDEGDTDVYLDADSAHFVRPLFDQERETAQDHMNELLEHSVIEEEDLAEFSICPSNCSIDSYASAQSDLNTVLADSGETPPVENSSELQASASSAALDGASAAGTPVFSLRSSRSLVQC